MSLLFTVVDPPTSATSFSLAGFLLQWPWGPIASLAFPSLYSSSLAAQQKGSRQSLQSAKSWLGAKSGGLKRHIKKCLDLMGRILQRKGINRILITTGALGESKQDAYRRTSRKFSGFVPIASCIYV